MKTELLHPRTEPQAELFDTAAERGLVGCILTDPSVIYLPEVAALRGADFHRLALGRVLDATRDLIGRGLMPDFPLLSSELDGAIPDSELLGILADDKPNVANAAEFALRIRDMAGRRSAVAAAERIAGYAIKGDLDRVTGEAILLANRPDAPDMTVDAHGRLIRVGKPFVLETHSSADIWALQEDRRFLVDGLLGLGDVVLIASDPGRGKTWLAYDLAVAVGAGLPFLDLGVKQGKSLILDEESGRSRLCKRLSQLARGRGIAPGTDLNIRFTSLAGLDLRDESHTRAIIEAALADGVKLILLDALIDFALGADENAAQEMAPIFHALRVIAEETGATVAILHHLSKAGQYRGSTSIAGAIDAGFALEDVRGTSNGALMLSSVKSRDGLAVVQGLRIVGDDVADTVKLEAIDLTPRGAKVKASERFVLAHLLATSGAVTVAQLQDAAGDLIAPRTVQNALQSLVTSGDLERANPGGRGVAAEYRLSKVGREHAIKVG